MYVMNVLCTVFKFSGLDGIILINQSFRTSVFFEKYSLKQLFWRLSCAENCESVILLLLGITCSEYCQEGELRQ